MYLLIALSLTHTTEVKPLPAEVFNQCHKIPALRKRSTRSSLERPLLPVCYPLNKEAQLAALMGFSQSISAGCCKCSSLGEHPILSIRHLLLYFFTFACYKHNKCQVLVVHIFNLHTQEAERGRSMKFMPFWSTEAVPSQPWLHRETQSQEKGKRTQ